MLSKDEILAIAGQPPRKLCGVYFLVSGDEVIYVGQSRDIASRVETHQRDKDFDAVAYIECDPAELNAVESDYIAQFSPRLNKGGPTKEGSWVAASAAFGREDIPYVAANPHLSSEIRRTTIGGKMYMHKEDVLLAKKAARASGKIVFPESTAWLVYGVEFRHWTPKKKEYREMLEQYTIVDRNKPDELFPPNTRVIEATLPNDGTTPLSLDEWDFAWVNPYEFKNSRHKHGYDFLVQGSLFRYSDNSAIVLKVGDGEYVYIET